MVVVAGLTVILEVVSPVFQRMVPPEALMLSVVDGFEQVTVVIPLMLPRYWQLGVVKVIS